MAKIENRDVAYISYNAVHRDEWNIPRIVEKHKEGARFDAFEVGAHGKKEKIAGLHYGVLGMCVGESRKIDVPPLLGYDEPNKWSDAERGHIPEHAILSFEITLIGLKKPGGKRLMSKHETSGGSSSRKSKYSVVNSMWPFGTLTTVIMAIAGAATMGMCTHALMLHQSEQKGD
jgi:hypothetical protein